MLADDLDQLNRKFRICISRLSLLQGKLRVSIPCAFGVCKSPAVGRSLQSTRADFGEAERQF
jgi:hypothetical protein